MLGAVSRGILEPVMASTATSCNTESRDVML